MRLFISKFDIFPALPTLRVQAEPQVVNFCGGIFSILIISAFLYIFFSILASTVNFDQIKASQKISTRKSYEEKVGNITVAIGLKQANLANLSNIFTVTADVFDRNLNFTVINTFPCDRQMWKNLPEDKYVSLKIDTYICLQREGVQIYGSSDSPASNMLEVYLSRCRNQISPVVCATDYEIDQFFRTNRLVDRFISASLLVLNTGFSANNKNPLTYTVFQKTLWLLFSERQQIIGQIFVGTYQINTDVDFLPFQNIQTETGYFVNECVLSNTVSQNTTDYIIIFFEVSPVHITIDRSFGKIDDILSYVGGLFGIIASFFGFFINSFNQYRYELRVSEGAFVFKDGHLARQQDLHFGKYVKYAIYDWVKMLFCYELKWNDCRAIEEARDQAVEQIEVKYLLKRIAQLEKVISLFVKPQKQGIVSLIEPGSIEQVKRKRNIQEYVEKFKDLQRSITIQKFEQKLNYILQHREQFGENQKIIPKQFYSITNKQSQSGLNSSIIYDEEEQCSAEIVKRYLVKYESRFDVSKISLDLSEEDLKVEQELAKMYFGLDQKTKKKIYRKIPLGILYRLENYFQENLNNRKEIANETEIQLKGEQRKA